MPRLILNIDETGNPDPLEIEDAVRCALQVVEMGKISETSRGKQYCSHTVLRGVVHVAVTKQPSGTETFNIYLGSKEDSRPLPLRAQMSEARGPGVDQGLGY